VTLTGAHNRGVGKFESLVQIPELKKGEPNESKNKHPSLPLPKLVVSMNADKEELHARLGED
jgi:hypothetical protein